MDCSLFILFVWFRLSFGSTASHYNGKRGSTSHAVHSLQPKETHVHYHTALHKKEEMLGQDSMRINDVEFKLQSLVSPEFHQGRTAMKSGKVYGNMEVNTLSPEQVDFVQSTSQWPRFSSPELSVKTSSRIIYPENPVLFPLERQVQSSNRKSNKKWTNMGSSSLKQGLSPYGNDIASMLSMPTVASSLESRNEVLERAHQKSNPMTSEERPEYMTGQSSPMGDKMSSLSELDEVNNLSLEAKKFIDFDSHSKDLISSFLEEGGVIKGGGKPFGILGNILKASQSMPSGMVVKPSPKPVSWFHDNPFSRRQKLERSKYIAPAAAESPRLKHRVTKNKKISKTQQKTKKTVYKKSKLKQKT